MPVRKSRTSEKKVAPSKKSRASKKKVAPEKKSRAKGKKVFAIKKQEYIPNIMLYVRVYGTNRAPYITTFQAALTADKLPYFSITLFSPIMIIISSLSFPGILHRASLTPSS